MLAKHLSLGLAVLAVVFVLAAPAVADWDPADGHKMHFPQLPDPNGWDVNVTADTMYDDWKCGGTGPVSDVHFWTSWQNDIPSDIIFINLEIDLACHFVPGCRYSSPQSGRNLAMQ